MPTASPAPCWRSARAAASAISASSRDGRTEAVERLRQPAIEPLLQALERLTRPGADGLENLRENAVLAGLHQRTGTLEAQTRAEQARLIVRKYARRAIVGAMAAVAPGSDLVIQGVLATGLTRALAELYGVKASDVQIEDFVQQARLTLRSGSSIVLAVAGNALKAFPGLGTLGGGVLHAFAYALIFDSMGRALAASLAERHTLDQDDAGERMKALLADRRQRPLAPVGHAHDGSSARARQRRLTVNRTRPTCLNHHRCRRSGLSRSCMVVIGDAGSGFAGERVTQPVMHQSIAACSGRRVVAATG